jgi:hypothetical protein
VYDRRLPIWRLIVGVEVIFPIERMDSGNYCRIAEIAFLKEREYLFDRSALGAAAR